MSSDSNEQRKQTADITNLQESFLQQQVSGNGLVLSGIYCILYVCVGKDFRPQGIG